MNKFLKTLINEKKIILIEYSENLVESYKEKSDNSLKSAEVLNSSTLYENSVSMSYYAMYNITLSLLYKLGIKCENHTGTILLLNDILLENELSQQLKTAKEERIDKQYYADYKATKQDSETQLNNAKIFVSKVKSNIINISNTDRESIKQRFNKEKNKI